MSLYGALYSSVSGIQAQGTAIGIISDNISNVNTVGYKAGSHYFSTLVTNSGSTVAYSPGGVRAQNRQLISQQGLIQNTSSPLDIAVSGNGFFVVQDTPDDVGIPTTMFTRAGSFRKDSVGNFVNAAGLYLKAWPLDENGKIPNNYASIDSLRVVNIGTASGNASATTRVEMGINLKADEIVLLGAGQTAKPGSDTNDVDNAQITARQIIVPNTKISQGDTLTASLDNGNTTADFEYGGIAVSEQATVGTPILGAADSDDNFSTATPSSGVNVSSFTITRSGDANNPLTFRFVANGAVAKDGTFTSLESLRDAINAQSGMIARLVNDRLYITAEDATQSIDFADTSTGTGSDFVTALGLANVPAATGRRFSTLEGLSKQVNQTTTLKATLSNPTTQNAAVRINNLDPLTNISFSDDTGTDELIEELGLTTAIIAPAYDAAVAETNMASGAVEPHFVRTFRVYDSLGAGHDVRVGFLKVGENKWRAEMYVNPGEISGTSNIVANGEVRFNGDGTLGSVDFNPSTDNIVFNWTNGASQTGIQFNFGTAGDIGQGRSDGMRQFAGTGYNVYFINQNGAEAGLLDSVSIDGDGYVIANYNNGQTQRLYKIPLADFQNPDGLIGKNGNAFLQSYGSGEVNLKEAGTGGVGAISPSSLEAANTELSEELTDMIVAQRAYQASAKVITTADKLLEELNRLIS